MFYLLLFRVCVWGLKTLASVVPSTIFFLSLFISKSIFILNSCFPFWAHHIQHIHQYLSKTVAVNLQFVTINAIWNVCGCVSQSVLIRFFLLFNWIHMHFWRLNIFMPLFQTAMRVIRYWETNSFQKPLGALAKSIYTHSMIDVAIGMALPTNLLVI